MCVCEWVCVVALIEFLLAGGWVGVLCGWGRLFVFDLLVFACRLLVSSYLLLVFESSSKCGAAAFVAQAAGLSLTAIDLCANPGLFLARNGAGFQQVMSNPQ